MLTNCFHTTWDLLLLVAKPLTGKISQTHPERVKDTAELTGILQRCPFLPLKKINIALPCSSALVTIWFYDITYLHTYVISLVSVTRPRAKVTLQAVWFTLVLPNNLEHLSYKTVSALHFLTCGVWTAVKFIGADALKSVQKFPTLILFCWRDARWSLAWFPLKPHWEVWKGNIVLIHCCFLLRIREIQEISKKYNKSMVSVLQLDAVCVCVGVGGEWGACLCYGKMTLHV